MTTFVVFTAAARDEVAGAFDWYERQAPGVGSRFVAELDRVVGRLAANPEQFPLAHKDVRRALMRRFPYALFFRVNVGRIQILACFHTSRDPGRWRTRL